MLKKIIWKPLLWILSIPLVSTLYALQNHPKPRLYVLVTPLDEATPFLPGFSVFYLLWYPFLFITLYAILQKNNTEYYRTLTAMCIGMIVSNGFFLLFQTHVPRPEVTGEGIFNALVRLTYAGDQPYNGFPSIHVLTCYLAILGSRVLTRPRRNLVFIISFLIILSTLFVKQHVLADVGAGIAVGEITFWLAGIFVKRKEAGLTSD